MKLRNLVAPLFLLFCLSSYAQENFNLELLANVTVNESSNDIWGYVDQNGIEYAIMGTQNTTKVYSLEDPTNPIERASIPGAFTTWRDIKTFNNHAYVTTDQGGSTDGLLIIDLNGAPEIITHTFWKPFIDFNSISGQLATCHNLYIDESGYCYLAGCGTVGEGGIIILDLNNDPKEPVVVGIEDEHYSHDVYVKDNLMYCSEIYRGTITMYDISDKSNPTFVSNAPTSLDFTHNAWLSDDQTTVFTTDERGDAFVDAFDLSDLMDPKKVDSFQPIETRNKGVIPHNTHFIDNYLVTSWYTDGVVITDVSDPSNMIKVGAYDTFLGNDGGFSGCWGVYPWLPSGTIIASDINSGLYVLRPTYRRASRLEGNAIEKGTGIAISGVQVEIQNARANEGITDAAGDYKLGVTLDPTEATFKNVRFSHPEYETLTLSTNLDNGGVTTLNVELTKKQELSITVKTIDANTGEIIPNAFVSLTNDENNVMLNTDEDGLSSGNIFASQYELVGGKWGYLHTVENIDIFEVGEVIIELTPGYQDDFVFDLGWTRGDDTGSTGFWERGIPVGTTFQGQESNTSTDVDGDIGNQCYVTGNAGGGAGSDDIDGGAVILISDIMDLSTYSFPVVEYNARFFNAGGQGAAPNDYFRISITNGVQTERLEEITTSSVTWNEKSSFMLSDYVTITDSMQLILEAVDDDPGHLVEAAFDAFLVTEGEPTSVNNQNLVNVKLSPNPTSDFIIIEHPLREAHVSIWDIDGKIIGSYSNVNSGGQIDLSNLIPGNYSVVIKDKSNSQVFSQSIIKH